MSQPSDNRDDLIFLCCALLILFCVVIPGLYAAYCGSINGPLLRLALLPVVAGLSYEALKLMAKSDSKWLKPLKAPGAWLQKHLTRP